MGSAMGDQPTSPSMQQCRYAQRFCGLTRFHAEQISLPAMRAQVPSKLPPASLMHAPPHLPYPPYGLCLSSLCARVGTVEVCAFPIECARFAGTTRLAGRGQGSTLIITPCCNPPLCPPPCSDAQHEARLWPGHPLNPHQQQ
jgi:hypothetical protein